MNTLTILYLCVAAVVAYPYYQLQIPNGATVPDPCNSGSIWLAVGHYDPTHHTQEKNPFALLQLAKIFIFSTKDFAAAGHVWTAALCHKDSDGDGKTNGEELGDPNCVWTVGATAEQKASGHPGICNPVGSCPGQSYSCGCHGNTCVGK
ncbi:hypothetical protein ACF0H5_007730 [Mactra antiquata]